MRHTCQKRKNQILGSINSSVICETLEIIILLCLVWVRMQVMVVCLVWTSYLMDDNKLKRAWKKQSNEIRGLRSIFC